MSCDLSHRRSQCPAFKCCHLSSCTAISDAHLPRQGPEDPEDETAPPDYQSFIDRVDQQDLTRYGSDQGRGACQLHVGSSMRYQCRVRLVVLLIKQDPNAQASYANIDGLRSGYEVNILALNPQRKPETHFITPPLLQLALAQSHDRCSG